MKRKFLSKFKTEKKQTNNRSVNKENEKKEPLIFILRFTFIFFAILKRSHFYFFDKLPIEMALVAKTGVVGNFRNVFIGSNQKLTNRI